MLTFAYTMAVLLSLLGLLLAFTFCRVVLRTCYVGMVALVSPLFQWAEPWLPVLGSLTFGAAHWARHFELRRAGMFREEGIVLGTWHGKALREPVGGHIALVGPPRSRKSWGLIMPCLHAYPGSVVVSDLRGELYEKTQTSRETFGPVFKFDPGTVTSCSLNPLDFVRWNTSYQYGDLMRQMRHLYPVKGDIADVYRTSAIPLALSIAMHCHQAGHASYPAMLAWMLDPSASLDDKLRTLLASPDLLISQGARRTLDAKPPFRQSVWISLLEPLTVFSDAMIASHTTTSDVTFDDLLYAPQPVSVFLCMGFHEISRLGVVLGLLVEALLGEVSSADTPPRHTVLLVLDECANLGKLAGLEKGLSYLQGSGCQCLLTFQNVAQVMQTYDPDSPLLASCSTKVYYTSNDVLTATAISQHGGETTVLAVSASLQNYTTSDTARPLITMDDALRLPQNDAIIFQQGVAPILARKLGAPAPTTPTGKVTARLRSYRHILVPAGVVAVLALTLWPLTYPRSSTPTTGALHHLSTALQPRTLAENFTKTLTPAPTVQADTFPPSLTPAPVVQAASLPWVFESTETQPAHVAGFAPLRFASAEECMGFLSHRYSASLARLQRLVSKATVTKEPLRWTWKIPLFGGKIEEYAAWCEEASATTTP